MTGGNRPRVGVLAVVWRGDRVLLVKKANPPQAGHWGFPGGKLEWGETVLQGAARECREETGLKVRPVRVATAVDYIDAQVQYVLVAVKCADPGGTPRAASDAVEVGWFALDELPRPLSPDVARVARAGF